MVTLFNLLGNELFNLHWSCIGKQYINSKFYIFKMASLYWNCLIEGTERKCHGYQFQKRLIGLSLLHQQSQAVSNRRAPLPLVVSVLLSYSAIKNYA